MSIRKPPQHVGIPTKGELMHMPVAQPRQYAPERRGHAARPGTGPRGESCGSCEHIKLAGPLPLCGKERLNQALGILAVDPACHRWKGQA